MTPEPAPREAGTGEARHWKLLLAAMLGAGVSGVPTYSIGLFIGPLTAEFGWTRTQIVFAITLLGGATMLLTPLVGRLVDIYGARSVALPAVCLMATALALVGLVESYNWYVAQWALVGIAGAFCSPVVWTVAVASRFERHRGLALAITLSGIGLIGVIAPLTSAWLVTNLGWRWAFAGLAMYSFAIVLPLGLLYFRDNLADARGAKSKAKPDIEGRPGLSVQEALRVREFWVLATSFLLAASAVMAIVLHFVPILIDAGISQYGAAAALSALSTAAIVGRLGGGWLLDRMFAPWVGIAILILPVIACIGLTTEATQGVLPYVYAVLIGLAVGAEFDLASYLSSRYFGFRNFATIYGLLFTIMSVGFTFGPILASILYDRFGGYGTSLNVLAGSFLAAAVLLTFCRAYPEYDTPVNS